MTALLRRLLERLLEAISIALLLGLAVVVVLAVVMRYSGSSPVWYDEVASVQLAWLTYFGAAYAALKRAHLGFPGVVLKCGPRLRPVFFVLGESIVIGFLVVMAWAGWVVLGVMAGESLVSVPWLGLQVTQSVIPVGCALFVLAQLLSAPDAWRRMRAGVDPEGAAIDEAIRHARETPAGRRPEDGA
ncbi:MAG: TRAP transporter small permease subunit [Rhodospirillales bacterium]|nr:TRAP transporter small permease subunit [Paracoccaceae bacterium]MDH3910801.1 TRAP transporter small permease subunit [Rhodospirillales bacterium]MDH3919546.1 TRAP transporter small permease subunit [Rhodospirillales bacterium]MDH3970341.1 TRAP transporter small permease subunit [Rhodospirillales bacterium]